MMKAVSKIAFSILFFAVFSSSIAQQQSLFTNYMLNNYAYNSGVVGSQAYMQANIYYRNQWTGFEGAPKTYMMSLYSPVKKVKNAALGGLIMADKTGLISLNTGYLTFAYHVKITKKTKLGFGISAGLKQYRVKLYDARTYDQGDELLTGNVLTSNTLDANAGLYLYSQNFFLGLSSLNMMNNKIRWKNPQGKLSPHYYGIIGYNFKIKTDYSIQPSILFKYNNPAPVQMEYSLKFTYKDLVWVGGSYREKDAFACLLGVTVIKKFNVAYAYDFALSTINKHQHGSHEISLSYNFIKKKALNASEEEEFKVIDNSVKQNLKNKKTDGERKKDETQAAPPKKEEPEKKINLESNEGKNQVLPKLEEVKTDIPKGEEPKTEETKPQLN